MDHTELRNYTHQRVTYTQEGVPTRRRKETYGVFYFASRSFDEVESLFDRQDRSQEKMEMAGCNLEKTSPPPSTHLLSEVVKCVVSILSPNVGLQNTTVIESAVGIEDSTCDKSGAAAREEQVQAGDLFGRAHSVQHCARGNRSSPRGESIFSTRI